MVPKRLRYALTAFGLLGASALARAGTCPPDPFLQAAHYAVPFSASAVGSADFNGDGHPDVVVTGDYETDILLGDGNGGLGPPTKIDDFAGNALVVGDFNGDGKPDVAIGGFGQVEILLSNGNGTFTNSYSQGLTGGTILFLLAVDLDGDHHLDLVLNDGGSLMVLIGNNDGTLKPPVDYPANGPNGVAAADFNEDGAEDLVAANGSSGTLSILHGNGNGSFGPPVLIPVGGSLTSVAAGDVDGDGHADIAVTIDADSTTGYVGILLGDGHGGFQAAVETPVGFGPSQLRLRDLDGDGLLDLVMLLGGGGYSVKSVGVCRGTGSASPEPNVQYLAGNTSRGLDVADLDGDGALDVLTADYYFTSPGVSVLLGNGGARLRSVVVVGRRDILYAIAGDFDGDGLVDVAAESYDDATTSILKGNGDGTFGAARPLGFGGALEVAGRFDADGSLDLIVGGYVLLNDGHGTFRQGQPLSGITPLATADLRGNGSTDLVGTDASNTQVSAVLGSGDGTFGAPTLTPLLNSITALVTGRVDSDARDDVACGTSTGVFGPNSVHVLLSNGDGTFTPTYDFGIGAGPLFLGLGDVTGDGKTDLLAANGPGGTLLFVGHGDGTFDDPVLFDGQYALGVFAADFDQDGVIDILTTNYNPTRAKWFRGTGGGSFAAPVLLDIASPGGVSLAPLTGSAPAVLMTGDTGVSFLVNGHLTPAVGNRSFVVQGRATLTVAASGFGPLTYQWRKGGVPLSDGGPISGATTATLAIDPVAFTDAGSYDILVTDACTTAASNGSAISVEFDDVPLSNPFHDYILAIAVAGITGGCNTGTSYCPGASVSRAEMAVFLLKSKFGSGHVPPPPPPTPIFADVPADAFAAAWIDELSTLGITGGCGNGDYCPSDPVTRGQMAVFLLKTLLGSGYVPPPATGIFADVPPNYFAIDWIEDLYNRGITAGCGTAPLRYCPDQAVPREQMAAFLVRTFGL